MYQALYRKWRPRSFDDVIGQEHITETLKRQLVSGRVSHAYLFAGTRGTGKTTCAKILARAANCEHPVNGNPCNRCASCVGIENGAILDVEELDAASNNGVDNIRALRDEAVFTPASVKKRVYIVDEVHMLSTSAFNALLKILEEPPVHLIFILATTEIQKVPATILSRCQKFSFKRIAPEAIAKSLLNIASEEKMTLEEDAADLLSRLADGSMRDALSLLDQCVCDDIIDTHRVLSAIGLAGNEETCKLLSAVAENNAVEALRILDRLYAEGKEITSILDELMTFMRDLLIYKIAPRAGDGLLSGSFSQKTISEFSDKIIQARLLSGVKTIQATLAEMAHSTSRRISAEMCLLQLCDESLSGDFSVLRSRISRLEDAVSSGVISNNHQAIKPDTSSKPNDEVELNNSADTESAAISKLAEQEPASDKNDFDMNVMLSGDDVWPEILKTVEHSVEISAFTFLNDKAHAIGELSGNRLTIKTKNVMANSMLDNTPVTMALKTAAERILGHSVIVTVASYGGPSKLDHDKLDSLKKFDNIKFE